jgi:hypothetical protein
MLAANQASETVVTFRLDERTGRPVPAGKWPASRRPRAVRSGGAMPSGWAAACAGGLTVTIGPDGCAQSFPIRATALGLTYLHAIMPMHVSR